MVVSPRATIFGYPWMDTLAHEYTHLVVSRLAHDAVPVWLQEGLARLEQTRWRKGPELQLSTVVVSVINSYYSGRHIAISPLSGSWRRAPDEPSRRGGQRSIAEVGRRSLRLIWNR